MRSFFSRLFRCFAPGSAYVVPIAETADSVSDTKKLGRGVRQKSQLDATSPDTEMDCIKLIEMIRVDVNITIDTALSDPTLSVLFSFADLTISSASSFRSPGGGKVHTGISLLRMLVSRTILRDVNDLHTESDTKALVLAITSFLDNLERLYNQKIKSSPEKKQGAGSLSHEGQLILTDLLMLAIHDYVSNSENNMTLSGEVYNCFERLCLTLNSLCVICDSMDCQRVRLMVCQCTARACKIIRSIAFSCAVSHAIEMPSRGQIINMASSLNALARSVMLIRKTCEDDSCAVSMLLWSACESLSCVLDIMPNNKNKNNKDKDNNNSGQKSPWTLIFDALRLTAPSPNDLLTEIMKLQNEQHIPDMSVKSHLDSDRSSALGSGLGSIVGSGLGSRVGSPSYQVVTELGSGLGCGSGSPYHIEGKDAGSNDTLKGGVGGVGGAVAESFRLQYLLDGLQILLRAGILENKHDKHISELRVIQEREKWMVSIAECLLFVLDHTLPSRSSTPLGNQSGGTVGQSWGVSPSSPVTPLAPILAGIFFEIALSFDANTLENTQNIHWIFWELSKRLAEFTEKLIKGKKSMSTVLKRASRAGLAGDTGASPSAAAVLRDIQAINGKLQLQLQLSHIKHQDVTFVLDDVVDGLWVLANGTQRWYPGRISTVNADGTYSVKYLDGDVHENKTCAEIRHSKNSKLNTGRSIRNLHSARSVTDTSRERSRERSESPMRPHGTLSGATVVTSRNSSTDSSPSPFFSFSYSSDFQTVEGGSESVGRVSGFQRKPSFRSISNTPRLSGLLENSSGWGGGDLKVGVPPLRPALMDRAHQAAIDTLDNSPVSSQDGRTPLKLPTLIVSSPSALRTSSKSLRLGGSHDGQGGSQKGSHSRDTGDSALDARDHPRGDFKDKDEDGVPITHIGLETPRSAPFLGQMMDPRSWKSDGSGFSGDSNESDGQTYAIPSVFPTPRSERRIDALVPKMQFANLDLSSAAIPGAGMSLSASICRESRDDHNDASGSDEDSEIDLIDTSRSRSSSDAHNATGSICTPRTKAMIVRGLEGVFDNFEDEVGVSHKVLTWRDQGGTQRDGYGGSGMSAKRTLSQSSSKFDNIDFSGGNSSGKYSRNSSAKSMRLQSSARQSSGRNLLSVKSSPLQSLRKMSDVNVALTARGSYLQGTGYDEQTLFVLIRAFSIISACLLQRCVVGEGTFLDISTCTTHETESSKSLLTKRRRKSDSVCEETPSTSIKSRSESEIRVHSLDSVDNGQVSKRRGRCQKVQKNHINMLFSIREFLESIPETELHNVTPFLTEISNFSLGASMRLLKLVSPTMFVSCLPSHMREAEKIGMGGFGSVFKVCCDSSCVEHSVSYINKNSTPYQSYNSRSNSGKRTQLMNAFNAGNKQNSSIISVKNDNGSTAFRTYYAVKRIPRERSVHDSPIVYDIFSEITSLELLSGNKGVCELIDFGVEGVEYWMVMEAGKMDLLAWRLQIAPKASRSKRIPPTRSPTKESRMYPPGTSMRGIGMTDLEESVGEEYDSPKEPNESKEEPLTRNKVALCLALYADALLIVQSVHSAHILHFDIKCNNFILRCEPDLDNMYRAHEKGSPSGYLFLADFGESVPSLVSYSNKARLTAEALVKEGNGDSMYSRSTGNGVSGGNGGNNGVNGNNGNNGNSVRSVMSFSDVKGGPSNLSRSRGTLAIQSPEMLCLCVTDNASVPTSVNGANGTSGANVVNGNQGVHGVNAIPSRPSAMKQLVGPLPGAIATPTKDTAQSEIDSHNPSHASHSELPLNPSHPSLSSSTSRNGSHKSLRAAKQQSDKKAGSRKLFPPPSAASDVWSLGCLLMELLTGHYLMADRPWTELYVSFCMKKFVPPTFELLTKALEPAGCPADLLPRLEAMVTQCLRQDPSERAEISDVFEDLMTMIIEHGALTPPKLSMNHSDSNSCSSISSSMSHTLEPRHVSSVLLSMKNLLSAKQVSRWSVNKTFNVVRWNRETSKLRPRSLDFRCGSGLVITLLGDVEFSQADAAFSTPSKYSTNTAHNTHNTHNTHNAHSSHNSSTLNTRSNSACHPYLPSTISGHNQDMTHELKGRIDAASRMIATASLATCAKNLAQKSVVNFVRDEGVFHIEISCGPDTEDEEVNKSYSMRGIERLVLPVWCGTGVVVDEEAESDFVDDLYSDTAVMSSIDRLLCLARATLSEPIPPGILITIVPYSPPTGEDFDEASYPYGTLQPDAYPRSERELKEKKDPLRAFTDKDDEDDAHSCVYSRVALTVAVTLADYFAKKVTVNVKAEPPTFRSPKGSQGIEVHSQAISPKGSHLMPRGNAESRRKHFELNQAASIIHQTQNGIRRRSFAVSQSLHAVAPWLNNALHPEFQSYLTERLNIPIKNIFELN